MSRVLVARCTLSGDGIQYVLNRHMTASNVHKNNTAIGCLIAEFSVLKQSVRLRGRIF